ncbi:hypothetical protein YC2023_034162 [Brassica napus]
MKDCGGTLGCIQPPYESHRRLSETLAPRPRSIQRRTVQTHFPAPERHYRFPEYESDCTQFIKALTSDHPIAELYGIVTELKLLLYPLIYFFTWISRERNRDADSLAKQVLSAELALMKSYSSSNEQSYRQSHLKPHPISELLHNSKAARLTQTLVSYPRQLIAKELSFIALLELSEKEQLQVNLLTQVLLSAIKGSILIDQYVKERIRLVIFLRLLMVKQMAIRNLIHHIIFFIHKIRSNLNNQ